MLFNSIDFAIFLPIVFLIYWYINNKNLDIQNLFVVIASYIFYGWWDYKFLSLIIFSTIIDFFIGRKITSSLNRSTKLFFLWTSIIINLGFLGFFKYYNFFVDNFTAAFSFFGEGISAGSLDIILPVGISFYTFQTLSYSIDVYRGKINPTNNFFAFAAFVCFFPQLVAGPIERATHLLPQFLKKRKFNYNLAVDGARQILWGLFKKIVIADNCATYANIIFNDYENYSGSTILTGAIFFAFQIYGDFSGYSDIAIGTSRLFGFDLKKNFAFPYFSRDIAEFWRRWHISLSTWFRDYLYIPLGGSRGGLFNKIKNTFIIFIVSGFWHGANWTFIFWGAINAIYFLPQLIRKTNRKNLDTVANDTTFPSFKELASMSITFLITCVAWIFFRAENINQALKMVNEVFSLSIFSQPYFRDFYNGLFILFIVLLFIIFEWFARKDEHALEKIPLKMKPIYRTVFYYALIITILFMNGGEQQFIYFQF